MNEKNFGIYQIKTALGACYYVVRPFGNYIIFADYLDILPTDLIYDKGGIAKLFFESRSNINEVHSLYFQKYGCSAVADFMKEDFSKYIPIHRWEIEHIDPAFKWYHHGSIQIITFKQRDKIVSILSNKIEYVDNQFFCNNKNVSNEIQTELSKTKTNLIYLTSFTKDSCFLI